MSQTEIDRLKGTFTQICEEPINKRLIERYLPWGTEAHEDPIFLAVLSFITDELRVAASVLQDLADNFWFTTREESFDEQCKRERFESIFNLIQDKALDLDALWNFAYATLPLDPLVLKRAQGRMADQSERSVSEHEDASADNTVN